MTIPTKICGVRLLVLILGFCPTLGSQVLKRAAEHDPKRQLDLAVVNSVKDYQSARDVVDEFYASEGSTQLPKLVLVSEVEKELFIDRVKRRLEANPRFTQASVPHLSGPHRERLMRSNVPTLAFTLPERQLSESRKLSGLAVTVYFCPDLETARALFLLRSGRMVVIGNSEPTIEVHEHRSTLIEVEGAERAYAYQHSLIYNRAPEEGAFNDGRDRVGAVAHNIVVEFAASTYVRTGVNGAWSLVAMASEDREYVVSTITSLLESL